MGTKTNSGAQRRSQMGDCHWKSNQVFGLCLHLNVTCDGRMGHAIRHRADTRGYYRPRRRGIICAAVEIFVTRRRTDWETGWNPAATRSASISQSRESSRRLGLSLQSVYGRSSSRAGTGPPASHRARRGDPAGPERARTADSQPLDSRVLRRRQRRRLDLWWLWCRAACVRAKFLISSQRARRMLTAVFRRRDAFETWWLVCSTVHAHEHHMGDMSDGCMHWLP